MAAVAYSAVSLPKKDVRLKITPEAHAALQELAFVQGTKMERLAANLLTRALLGEVHLLHRAVDRLAKARQRRDDDG